MTKRIFQSVIMTLITISLVALFTSGTIKWFEITLQNHSNSLIYCLTVGLAPVWVIFLLAIFMAFYED